MTNGGVENAAMRLLGAFYDLSGGKLNEPVPMGETGASEGAVQKAGLDPGLTADDVGIRYLLDKGYVRETGTAGEYAITVAGGDKVRELRGTGGSAPSERSGMSEQMQRRLLTVLGIVLSQVLSRPLLRLVSNKIPDRRGVGDDVLEAVIKGATRTAALVVASALVRRLAGGR